MRALKCIQLVVCLILFTAISQQISAQSTGDYRSVAGGNWGDPASWQQFNGTTWVAATDYPASPTASLANVVRIQNTGFTMTLDVNPVQNRIAILVIDSGGVLIDAGGAFNFTLHAITRITVNGTLTLTNTTDVTSKASSSALSIGATGLLSAWSVEANAANNFGTANIYQNITGGQWTNLVNSILRFRGSSISSTLVPSGLNNTVDYNSSSDQTIKAPTISYFNLTISGSGIKTLEANTVVQNNLSIQGSSSFYLGISSNLSVGGNWNNSSTSTMAFVPTFGTVTFNGSSQQSIINTGHGSGTILSSVVFANTSATIPQITISNSSGSFARVTTSLTMTSGVINLNNGGFAFAQNFFGGFVLNHSGTSASGWFYNGTVYRLLGTNAAIASGSNSGLVPVGTSTDFRPFYFSTVTPPTASTLISITAPGTSSFVDVSLTDGASTIRRQNRSGWLASSFGNGTYNIRAGGTGLGIIGSVADLRLTPASLVLGSAGTNSGTTSNPLVERTGLTLADLNTTFYVGSVNLVSSPLPVELISFIGETEGSVVNLNWITKSELNCDYFTVYRSVNGIDFVSIGNKKGAGTTNELNKYDLQDTNPLNGTNYYRLEQTDWDGKKTILSMISVDANGSDAIQIYPNPVERGHSLELKFQGLTPDTDQSIVIINQLGQQVYNSIIHVDEIGSFIGSFKIPQLSTGSYFIKINGKVKRLLVQ